MKPIKKELFVTGQQLRFSQTPKVDPEGQTAVREFAVQAPAGYQQGNAGAGGVGDQQGVIPAIVQYTSTVGELAQGKRSACVACKHFDNRAWRKFVENSTGPLSTAESRQTIETLRNRLILKGAGYMKKDGTLDVEESLMSFGICRVLSDWVESVVGRNPMHWPITPQPEANCPPSCHAGTAKLDVVTPAAPYGFFVPKDLDAEKVGAHRYDQVMRLAQGRK